VVVLFVFQPVLGYIHHMHFVKHQRRGIISYIHILFGQALMTVGIFAGWLGLRWADASKAQVTIYWVLAAIFISMYIAARVWRSLKSRPDATKDEGGSRNLSETAQPETNDVAPSQEGDVEKARYK
jgi:uncharacterized membrane protein YfcA